MTYRIEALADHDCRVFTSGHVDLDKWLKQHARTAAGQGTRTYLLVRETAVVGYFSVAPHLLSRSDAPRTVARGAPEHIPALLLAKLALDRSVQGQGLGSELLTEALRTMLIAARHAGGRLVVVDAIDEPARRFYLHHDFQPLPNQPRRLIMKLSTAAKALDLTWP